MDLVDKEIDRMAEMLPQTRKVFLADGNAMVLSFSKLENILDKLRCRFDHLVRVSAYATPSDLQNKTDYIEANPRLWGEDDENPVNVKK